jgi:hypothetical protein
LEFDLTKKVRENEKESLSLFFLPFFSFLVFVSRENDRESDWLGVVQKLAGRIYEGGDSISRAWKTDERGAIF